MRTLFPFSLFLFLASPLFAADAPAQLAPETPASTLSFAAAPNAQVTPFAASNGQMALCVFSDNRANAVRPMAARIDSEGRVLDPLGIALDANFHPSGVAWNGTDFAVVGSDWVTTRFIFVDPQGKITGSRAVPGDARFVAATTDTDVRILLSDGTIANGRGDVVAEGVPVLPRGYEHAFTVAATGGSRGFLLLSAVPVGPGSVKIIASRVDRNGDVLSVTDAKMPVAAFDASFGSDAVAEGDDGYLFVTYRGPAFENGAICGVHAWKLDTNGVFTTTATTLAEVQPQDRVFYGRVVVAFDGDRYVAAWHTSLITGASYTYAASIDRAGTTGSVKQVQARGGLSLDVALAIRGGQRQLVWSAASLGTSSGYDLLTQRLSASAEASAPAIVAGSATLQGKAHIALSAHGYALTWSENGPEPFAHVYFRRFLRDGAPIDEQPIELARVAAPFISVSLPENRIAATADTYVAAGYADGMWRFRRFPAAGGPSTDDTDFTIAASPIHMSLATNGLDVLAAFTGSEPASLRTRRIRMFGPPLADRENFVSGAGAEPVIASNGIDYLVAWADSFATGVGGTVCGIFCRNLNPPYRLLATRVRADGVPLESSPFQLLDKSAAMHLSVAGNSKGYLFAWSLDGVSALRISNEGRVSAPSKLETANGTATVTPLGSAFALLLQTTEAWSPANASRPTTFSAAFLSADDLPPAETAPRVVILRQIAEPIGAMTGASMGRTLWLSYDRIGTQLEGFVPRVVTRVLSDNPRRRSTH